MRGSNNMGNATAFSTKKILTWVSILALCTAIVVTPFITLAQGTSPATPTEVSVPESGECPTGYTKHTNPNISPSLSDSEMPRQDLEQFICYSDAYVAQMKSDGKSCNMFVWTFTHCIAIPVASWISSWFLTLGGTLLLITGGLFDILIQHIIIDFKGTLQGLGILGAIDIGWSVFRDLTNLFIIGLFVFIAINIILGVEKFGQKKLIANVLIIAVLLNFSLLFTKIIIDGSNFTAFQIYKQISQPNGSGANETQDIAQGFLKPMGITSVWNTQRIVATFGKTQDSAMQALMFGIVGGILLIAVAMVLAYGCYVIAARAIMLILLMLTASLAFATFLVPSLQQGEYGWDTWWKTLLNAAIFAPLLMIFLFISMIIMNQAGKATANSSVNMGTLIANPQAQLQAGGWQVIFVYLIGTGLLFASFKVSSKLAGSVPGFGSINGGLMTAFGKWPAAGVLMGGAAIASSVGIRRFGAPAAQKSIEYDEKINQKRNRAAMPGLSASMKASYAKDIDKLTEQKAKLDKTASRDFNFLNTSLGRKLGQAVGVQPGKPKGGFVGPRKEAAQEAAKEVSGLALSRGDAAKLAEEFAKSSQPGRADIEASKKASEQLVRSAEAMAESAKNSSEHQGDLAHAEKEKREGMERQVIIQESHQAGKLSDQEKDIQIKAEDEKIQSAQKRIIAARRGLQEIADKHLNQPHVAQARQVLDETTAALKYLDREVSKKVQQQTLEIQKNSIDTAIEVGANRSHADDYQKHEIAKEIRKKHRDKSLTDQLRVLREADDSKPTT